MLENEISVWLPTLGWKVLTEIGFEIFERYSETGSRFASGRSCHLAVIFSSPTAFTGPNTNAQFLHKFLFALNSSHEALAVPLSLFSHNAPFLAVIIKIAP